MDSTASNTGPSLLAMGENLPRARRPSASLRFALVTGATAAKRPLMR